MVPSLILLAIILGVVIFIVSIYNRLVILKNRYKNGFAQIEVQLKRRYDLIPNLVETAKAYMAHERDTLEAVTAARTKASGLLQEAKNLQSSDAIKGLASAENSLMSALGRFSMVMEAYPELKASDNMMQLSEELSSTENKVAFARQAYNDAVTLYNSYRQSFPAVAFAPMFGHGEDAALLEFADSAAIQQAPKVSF